MRGGPSVCVIGAGAIGLASALALARRGAGEVTVLEARHVAAGSSGLSVGIVETQYVEPLDIELRVRSMERFEDWERERGLRVVHNGYLRLAHTPDALEGFAESVRVQRALGVRDARVVDRGELERLVPDLAVDDLAGGLFGPSDGFLDGHLYCSLLAELAEQEGVRLLAGRELVAAERDSAGWALSVRRTGGAAAPTGGSVPAGAVAAGDAEVLRCEVVVNAAGAWAQRVAALLGVEMALLPQRHQAVAVHLPHPLPYTMPSVMDYTPGSGRHGVYFRHERPGQLIAGLHTEEALAATADPDRFARSADAEFLEDVAALLTARLPALAASRLAHGWAGLYPVSPDGLPLLGPAPEDSSVILAGGAGGSGIQLSPVLGELVADWVLHGEPRAVAGAVRLRPGRPSLTGGAPDSLER